MGVEVFEGKQASKQGWSTYANCQALQHKETAPVADPASQRSTRAPQTSQQNQVDADSLAPTGNGRP